MPDGGGRFGAEICSLFFNRLRELLHGWAETKHRIEVGGEVLRDGPAGWW